MPPAGAKEFKYWRRPKGTATSPKTASCRYGWARSGACSSPRGPNDAVVIPSGSKMCSVVYASQDWPFENIGGEYDASAAVLKPCPRLRGDRHGGELTDDPLSCRWHLNGPLLVGWQATRMGQQLPQR